MPSYTPILYPMHPVNRAHFLAHGLVAWWLVHPTMNAAGTLWRDMVRGHVGTIISMTKPPTATSGWGRSARQGSFGELRFDGNNDRVELADHADWAFTSGGGNDLPFSLSASIYATDVDVWQTIIAKQQDALEWTFTIHPGAALTLNLWDAGTDNLGREFVLSAGTHNSRWLHVACTYDGSNAEAGIQLYLDGRPVSMASVSGGAYGGMTNTPQVVKIGGTSGTTQMFTGKMDDIRIYNYALGATQMYALYANSLAGYPGLLHRRRGPHVGAWAGAAPVELFRPFMVGQAVNRAYRY